MLTRDKLRFAGIGIGGAIYLVLSYLASSSTHPPLVAVLATAIPIVAGLLTACWRTRLRIPAIVLCVVAVAIFAQRSGYLLSHAAWLYFFQHVGVMAALGVMFGSTLRAHESALCSRIARVAIAATLDADYLRYTWRVTFAWTLYFATSAVISVALFFGSSLEVWSLFATVFTPMSVPAMFAAEYMIRLRALPNRPHFSIAQTIASYQKYMQRAPDCAE